LSGLWLRRNPAGKLLGEPCQRGERCDKGERREADRSMMEAEYLHSWLTG
jgi:hypothetical protein